jgi:hypothetical protein
MGAGADRSRPEHGVSAPRKSSASTDWPGGPPAVKAQPCRKTREVPSRRSPASRTFDAKVRPSHRIASEVATHARADGRPQKRRRVLPDTELSFDLQGNCVHRYAQGAVRRLLRSGKAMAQLLSSCMFPTASPGLENPATSPWPMPPPLEWIPGPPPLSGRRRQRWRFHATTATLTNLMVVTLSHLAVGCARRCPDSACSGRALRDDQRPTALHVQSLAEQMCRPPFYFGGRGKKKT